MTPNDPYRGRTAPLTSRRCILYIYSTNVGTEYFKHVIYSSFLSLQNAVCFIILTYLVPVLFTFYIQCVPKFKSNHSGAKRLKHSDMFRSCQIIIRELCSSLKLYYGIHSSILICKRGIVAACHVVWECVVEQWLGVRTTCHTQYTWDRSICIFYLIEQHSKFLLHTLQVLCTCTLCIPELNVRIKTAIETITNHHRWHATTSLERTRL